MSEGKSLEFKTEKPGYKVRVYMIDRITGEILNEFDTVKNAAAHIGVNSSNISNCFAGKQKTTGGFKFVNADEHDRLNYISNKPKALPAPKKVERIMKTRPFNYDEAIKLGFGEHCNHICTKSGLIVQIYNFDMGDGWKYPIIGCVSDLKCIQYWNKNGENYFESPKEFEDMYDLMLFNYGLSQEQEKVIRDTFIDRLISISDEIFIPQYLQDLWYRIYISFVAEKISIVEKSMNVVYEADPLNPYLLSGDDLISIERERMSDTFLNIARNIGFPDTDETLLMVKKLMDSNKTPREELNRYKRQ